MGDYDYFRSREIDKRLKKYHDIIEKNPKRVFPVDMDSIFDKYFPSAKDKDICIPYSGDNLVAYAFHCQYAKVKSIDYVEELVTEINNMNLNGFSCDCAVFEETNLPINKFDLLFTTIATIRHIENLKNTFCIFNTILKDDGKYIFFDNFDKITCSYKQEDVLKILQESGFLVKQIIHLSEQSIDNVIYKGVDRKGWTAMCCMKQF